MNLTGLAARIVKAVLVGILTFGLLAIIAFFLRNVNADVSNIIAYGAPIIGILVGLYVFFTNKNVSI